MAITLRELDSLTFPEVGRRERGYQAEAVDAFKSRIRDELVEVFTHLQDVEQQLVQAQQALSKRPEVEDHTATVASQSSDLLARAEALANEHVRNAERAAQERVAQAEEILRRAETEATLHAEERLAEVQEKTAALIANKKQEFNELEAAAAALRAEQVNTRERLRAYFAARLDELSDNPLGVDE